MKIMLGTGPSPLKDLNYIFAQKINQQFMLNCPKSASNPAPAVVSRYILIRYIRS